METNHQQEQVDLGSKINNNSSSSSSYLCRQSSSRWTPTNDQIRILKELYYNNGIRSPTADQIQRIAARLRHYGKIEGKNVFYWFQNHKARERQKKRFTSTQPPPPSITTTTTTIPFSDNHHMQTQSHHHHHLPPFYNYQQQPQHKLYSTHQISPPTVEVGSSSSQAVLPVGCGAYGSIAMEKSFRECSISPDDTMVARETIQNIGSWAGVYSYSFDNIKPQNEEDDDDDDDDGGDGDLSTEIETLQLFPIQGGSTTTTTGGGGSNHDHIYSTGGGGWFRSDARTSLELSLNSYGYYN